MIDITKQNDPAVNIPLLANGLYFHPSAVGDSDMRLHGSQVDYLMKWAAGEITQLRAERDRYKAALVAITEIDGIEDGPNFHEALMIADSALGGE